MNWPEEWRNRLDRELMYYGMVTAEQKRLFWDTAFDTLHELGALKDPPKPREFWLTGRLECGSGTELPRAFDSEESAKSFFKTLEENNTKPQPIIHVREVTEEEDA